MIVVAIIFMVITVLAVALVMKFRKMLGNWSKILLAFILTINSIQVYFSIKILAVESSQRNYDHDHQEFIDLILLKAIYDYLKQWLAIFMFNVVIVKVYFIQRVLESYSC